MDCVRIVRISKIFGNMRLECIGELDEEPSCENGFIGGKNSS